MEQIYKLNYETFVEEIPQHQQNQGRRLIDKFDKENTYIIAKDEGVIVGMIAVRANRPFSLDYKIDDLDHYLPKNANPCEVRLLSVKRDYRKSWVFYQLVNLLVSYCLEKQYNMALISGTDRQIRLYKRIGFEPFGPMVGREKAMFQPMYLTKKKFETTSKAFSKMMKQKKREPKKMNFLPGPVAVHKEVEQVFRKTAISHRSSEVINEMKTVRTKLCELVNAKKAQIAVGTGTLANDLVAAQIKKLPGKGLILANGEFGYRLIDHAERFGLEHYTLEKRWNEGISAEEIKSFLETHQDVNWLWTVHCETSTGYLYDLNKLLEVVKKHHIKLCVDACSSVGVVPVDFQDVYLASTVSGKGLGSYPGLAIVFHQETIAPNKEIPRYLDLGIYAMTDSIPYTHSSNLISALHEAVKKVNVESRHILANEVRKMLTNAGFTVLGNEDYLPGIMTIPLPYSISSKNVGDQLKENGIIISYESDYLLQRNWIQFALMGNLTLKEFETSLAILQDIMNKKLSRFQTMFQNKRWKHIEGIKLVLMIASILWLKTVIVCLLGFNLSLQSWFDIGVILISSLGSLLFVMGFSFYFSEKVNRLLLFGLLFIGTFILYGDLLYYRFYIDFVSAPILFQFDNVGGLSASTVELMNPWDLCLFIDLFLVGWFLFKTRATCFKVGKQTKKLYAAASLTFTIITIGLGIGKSVHLFSESYDREQMVKSLGLLNYHVYDIALGMKVSLERFVVTEADAVAPQEYFQHKNLQSTDLFGIAEGKNVVVISMESTQDFVIHQKVNGEEITPFLNDLIKDSFYFSQVYDQTAQGKTSDAEFMIDTGLYPLASGSVFVRRPENVYYSLPHLLKEKQDYYAAAFHGNVSTFWNRDTMYKTLGYDKFFSKKDYIVTEENSINYGIKDIPYFNQSIQYLETIPEPYYAKFLTLTNHFPFLLEEEDMFIEPAATKEGVVNRYVTTVRYLDKSIEMFFKQLKEKGMYEDTMFVLVGDHYGISEKYEEGLSELLGEEINVANRMKHRQVPLIIHIPGHEGKIIDTQGGEIDIRPTLLHLLGIKKENNYSFGHDLFTRDPDYPVVFRDGSFISKNYIYKDSICYRKESGQAAGTHHCEPYLDVVRQELTLSDKIIFGDLLRFMKPQQ
ncbi:hypothetical protein CJ483_23670 [Bacillus sp. PK3_68]|nr:hypothetical protein CJ483_23670 [Bacillus sp. PK3_68]